MPGYLWRNPAPPYQIYGSTNAKDPNVPAGYVRVGADGSFAREPQDYSPGAASGGHPRYAPSGFPMDTVANVKLTLQQVNGTAPGPGGY